MGVNDVQSNWPQPHPICLGRTPLESADLSSWASRWSQIKPESVMTWARAMVANRQATSGDEWTEHQVRHSSGTCRGA